MLVNKHPNFGLYPYYTNQLQNTNSIGPNTSLNKTEYYIAYYTYRPQKICKFLERDFAQRLVKMV